MVVASFLVGRSRTFHSLSALVTAILVGLLDYATGHEIAFSIFYLLPVAQATWFVGRAAGIALSVVSAILWLAADLTSGHLYTHPAIPFWNMGVRFGFFLIVTLSLAALRSALAREKDLAATDPLTGAANPRRFYELLQVEKDRALRYSYPITLVYVDIDDFKCINDRFGHQIGDRLLCSVVATIQSCIRSSDSVARLGGDEFIILLVEIGPEQAQAVIARMRQRLLETMRQNGWPVTFSFGAITFYDPSSPVDEMIGMVDALMYTVKGEGKNTVKYEVHSG